MLSKGYVVSWKRKMNVNESVSFRKRLSLLKPLSCWGKITYYQSKSKTCNIILDYYYNIRVAIIIAEALINNYMWGYI